MCRPRKLAAQIAERDERDRHRAQSPLMQAPDAVYLDSTGLTPEQVEEEILKLVRARISNGKEHWILDNLLVMKFGGTSVGSAERMKAACDLIAGEAARRPVVAVVSAMSKITDLLLDTTRHAEAGDQAGIDYDLRQLEHAAFRRPPMRCSRHLRKGRRACASRSARSLPNSGAS